MDKFIAAAIQMSSSSNKEENLNKAINLINEAVKRDAIVISLPELFNVFTRQDVEYNYSESINGETISILKKIAKKNKVYILCGSILEKAKNSKSYNTSIFLSPNGKILAKYRKIHLFDTSLSRKESDTRLKGNKVVVCNTTIATFGFSICYDLRFGDLYYQLNKKGAEVIFVPSAFILHTGKDHWEVLLRARAIENQVYIIAPNQFGKNQETGIINYGRSLIIDPWGTILAQAPDRECVITAEIDLSKVYEVKKLLGFSC